MVPVMTAAAGPRDPYDDVPFGKGAAAADLPAGLTHAGVCKTDTIAISFRAG